MLETTLLDLSALYNDYAQPLCMWDICLRALDTSDTASAHPDIVRSLWENLLVGEDGSAVSLDDARQRLVELGPLLSPHKGTLPLSYIVQHVFGIAGERLQLQSCVSAVAEDVIRCTTSSSMVHALGAFGEIMQSSHEPTYIQAAAVAVAHLAK